MDKETGNPEVIQAYIEEYVNNRTNDIRLYDPPPPPEWKDSLQHKGRRKHDSVLQNLKILRVYVNHHVAYDTIIPAHRKFKVDDDFMKKPLVVNKGFLLDHTAFSKKDGIMLAFISSDEFFENYEENQRKEGYGGFFSFKNLYYSKDGKKAIFEMNFYKRKMNGSSSVIYAEKDDDGTWKFQSELKSIS
ncbi:hypothetical protein [Croceitalea sp. MTPC5]|uniref:hypothetical protein n=1 Tax=Croceitalea sp. MTPC5 TaxID=3056565 RepID=UPI0030CC31A4